MDSSNFITIFTPAYNRAHLLQRLYDSLLIQTYKNFEWLIVDDGSTDNTKQIVDKFIEENKLQIKYIYKDNGGKHTAINTGVQQANFDLFLIVDSDDFLPENAVSITFKAWQNVKDNSKVCGIIGLSQFTNGKIIGDKFLQENWQIPFVDYYLKYKLRGDKSVAFKTEILKKYPFPEKQGIKLVIEAVVWEEMSKKYDVICVNKVLQYVEYLENGLSDSFYKIWYIKSMAFSFFQLIENNTYPFSKFPKPHLMNFVYLATNSLLAKENYFYQLTSLKSKVLYIALFPRAYYAYHKMKNKILQ